jgi:hypothetical protein
MALGASLSFAAARAGILGGLLAVDMIFARFIVAGAIMLPLLLRFRLFAVGGLHRVAAALARAGPARDGRGFRPLLRDRDAGLPCPGRHGSPACAAARQVAGLGLVTLGLLTTVRLFQRLGAR